MKRDFIAKTYGHFSPSFSCFATRYLCFYCQRPLVDEEFLELRWGTHNRSEMVPMLGTPFSILPHNSNKPSNNQKIIKDVYKTGLG
jgi:hypothetical protein